MWSSLSRFTELRRGLPLIAAGLLLLALAVPVWRITLTAPQYPSQDLLIELYAYPRMGGDYVEVNGLNKYVGFYYPDPVYVDPNFPVHEKSVPVPEWVLGPVAFVAVAAAGIFVSLAPTVRKLKVGLTAQLAGTLATFAGMFVIIQVRLYQVGHSLDPDAPLSGVESFTPPVLGGYEVANISGFAWFGPGGYLTILAIVLLVVAFLARDTDATFGDLPAIVRERSFHVRQPAETLAPPTDRGGD
jgi:amino acid transporter